MKEWSDLSLWAEGMKQIEKDIEKTKDLITKEYEKCIRKRCAEACAEPWLAFKKFAPPSMCSMKNVWKMYENVWKCMKMYENVWKMYEKCSMKNVEKMCRGMCRTLIGI